MAAKKGVAESCQYLLDKTGQLGTVVGIIECVDYLPQAGLSPNHKEHERFSNQTLSRCRRHYGAQYSTNLIIGSHFFDNTHVHVFDIQLLYYSAS